MKYRRYKPIVVCLVGFLSLLPFAVDNPYYLHLVIMVYINAILGMGFSLIYSTGLITLGASAFWAIGAYASALLAMKSGVSVWLAMPFAMVITGIVALLIGALIVRYAGIGIVVFSLIICFLMERVFGYVEGFGGWGGIVAIPKPELIKLPFSYVIDFSNKVPWYYLSLFLVILTMLVLYLLDSSRIGRAWRSIRLDSRLAEAVGIYVYGYRLTAFVIASAFAGLAGSFYAHYSTTITPETFGILKSIHIQIYSILGGLDYYILGPLIGSAIFTLLPEFLQIRPEIEPYITGSVLIVIVIFLPSGIAGLAQWASLRISGLFRRY
ncbi:MAG: branched-chain amino acid ABC transporter permease [Alphaproteobacteria bacterium]